MLGTDSLILRVNPDGSLAPFEQMPALFFDRPIRQVLAGVVKGEFEDACALAIADRVPQVFCPEGLDESFEIMITPILDDDSIDCRFLVCWARHREITPGETDLGWADLQLTDVTTRYRVRLEQGSAIIDAAPWWALPSGQLLELWPHHTNVSAMGLGHSVMETLIYDAVEAAAAYSGGPTVRIEVPSADMLAGLVPVFHGAIRAFGFPAERIMVAIDVALAVDQDLLPIIVHLRTLGMKIDIVGLDAFTSTLHTVSDTSSQPGRTMHAVPQVEIGQWASTVQEAIRIPA